MIRPVTLDALRRIVNGEPDDTLEDLVRAAIAELEVCSEADYALKLLELDADDITAATKAYIGASATVGECVAELIERSAFLAEWQEMLDGEDFEEVIAKANDATPWDAIAVTLWRNGFLTASELDGDSARQLIVERLT